ncbi:ABC transporter permease [Oceanithermus sp.]
MKAAWWVALKEITSTWRDKRTIRNVLLMPLLLMPFFMYGPSAFLGSMEKSSRESVQEIAVCNLPPQLTKILERYKLKPVELADPRQAVISEQIDAALCAENGSFVIYAQETAKPIKAGFVVGKIQQALDAYKQQLIAEKLRAAGLDTGVLEPFKVRHQDLSPKQAKSAGTLGSMTPYFLMLFIMMGAVAVVIDATAGEKEKGTLEVLLAAPVSHLEIAAGKLLAGLAFAVLTSVSGLIGLAVGAAYARRFTGGSDLANVTGSLSLSTVDFGYLFVTALLYAAMITALLLAVGMYARSYKEAQTYIGPLYMLLIVPMLVLMFAADYLKDSLWLYAVPVFNVYLAMDQLIKGQAALASLAICWLSTALAVLAALWWAARNFSSESVIFRN